MLELGDTVISCLKDKEANVRAMAAWCVGKIASNSLPKVFNLLLPLLDDSHLQVRTSACISIGGISNKSQTKTLLDKLKKILKDGSINREVVCETILRLPKGDLELITILDDNLSDPIVLKAIIKVLKNLDITSPNTDSALDLLIKVTNHDNRNVRVATAETLVTL